MYRIRTPQGYVERLVSANGSRLASEYYPLFTRHERHALYFPTRDQALEAAEEHGLIGIDVEIEEDNG